MLSFVGTQKKEIMRKIQEVAKPFGFDVQNSNYKVKNISWSDIFFKLWLYYLTCLFFETGKWKRS